MTLDIETHGSEDGIGISDENGTSWNELFEHTRPINIACGGLLIITLSVCFGISHLVAIRPEGRAPFMGIVASNRSMRPQELYDCFSEFYKLYTSPLSIGIAMNALHESFKILGKDSPFAFILSSQWFDEFFKEERIVKVAKEKAPLLASAEGIDEECAKYQIIDDLNELRDKNRNYFNFLDISGITDLPVQYIIP